MSEPVVIKDRTTVVFKLPEGEIVVSIRENKLRVCGEGRIVVRPEASNLVFVDNDK
jgi:hypothetical protein